jgi:glycosyltransferase involved in cell wall biosynthesis
MHGPFAFRSIFTIGSLARQFHADIIHTHLTRATYMGYFAGILAHVPVISTVHVLTRDFAYRYLPRSNHWLVAVSDYLRLAIIQRGFPASRVRTIYNGTDFLDDPLHSLNIEEHDAISPALSLSVRAEMGLPADAELVGQFGRVDSFKGAPLLVRAAKIIVNNCPRAYFVFVGHAEPGIQQALWEIATELGVEDRFRFTGVRNDVPRLMEAMDVITVPSLTETFGMVIVEAMASGKAVVATRAGGIPEVVAEGSTGLLVEREPAALADAVISLLSDPARRETMGLAGLDRARTLFSAKIMATNMEQFYQGVIKH